MTEFIPLTGDGERARAKVNECAARLRAWDNQPRHEEFWEYEELIEQRAKLIAKLRAELAAVRYEEARGKVA